MTESNGRTFHTVDEYQRAYYPDARSQARPSKEPAIAREVAALVLESLHRVASEYIPRQNQRSAKQGAGDVASREDPPR